MLYMQEVERMEGYGEESYPAKVSGARRPGLSKISLSDSRRMEDRRESPGRPAVRRLTSCKVLDISKLRSLWPR